MLYTTSSTTASSSIGYSYAYGPTISYTIPSGRGTDCSARVSAATAVASEALAKAERAERERKRRETELQDAFDEVFNGQS